MDACQEIVERLHSDDAFASRVTVVVQRYITEVVDYASCCGCEVTYGDIAQHLCDQLRTADDQVSTSWDKALKVALLQSKLAGMGMSDAFETLGRGGNKLGSVVAELADAQSIESAEAEEKHRWWQFWKWL